MKTTTLKRAAFLIFLVFWVLGLTELAVNLAYLAVRHGIFPYSRIRARIQSVAAGTTIDKNSAEPGAVVFGGREILHPYFGYVYDPRDGGRSAYGFMDDKSPILQPSSVLNVAILGGSFAGHVYLYARKDLIEQLHALSPSVTVANLALPGYKQPQQLLVLAYLLSLGAHFDIVINIDGFNEVALPAAENIPNGVYPFYPRGWQLRTADISEPELAIKLARLGSVRDTRHDLARFFQAHHLSRSAILCTAWALLDRRLQSREHALSLQVNETRAESRPTTTGPPWSAGGGDALYRDLARHWGSCSRLMDDLCRRNRAVYFHFLQPNQYVAGSKPMGREEAAIALDQNINYRLCVLGGYPHLRDIGAHLATELNFYDMTMIFSSTPSILYSDNCCHLNKDGYRILSQQIGKIIVNRLFSGGELPAAGGMEPRGGQLPPPVR